MTLARLPLAGLLLAATTIATAAAADIAVPRQTAIRFHLVQTVSSRDSKSGEPIRFAMVDPIVVDGQTIVDRGAVGSGVLLLAGHAGTGGHEGDLTLRLDTVPTADGRHLAFDEQRLEINGRNRKTASFLAGLIPFAGYGASFIRGGEVVVDPKTVIRTVLTKDAIVADTVPAPPPTR